MGFHGIMSGWWWLEHDWIIFPYIGKNHHLNWLIYFVQRGRYTTNQIWSIPDGLAMACLTRSASLSCEETMRVVAWFCWAFLGVGPCTLSSGPLNQALVMTLCSSCNRGGQVIISLGLKSYTFLAYLFLVLCLHSIESGWIASGFRLLLDIAGMGNIPQTTLFLNVSDSYSVYRSASSNDLSNYMVWKIFVHIWGIMIPTDLFRGGTTNQYTSKGVQPSNSRALNDLRGLSRLPRPNHTGLWLLWWMRASLSWPAGRETHWKPNLHHTSWSSYVMCISSSFRHSVVFLKCRIQLVNDPTWFVDSCWIFPSFWVEPLCLGEVWKLFTDSFDYLPVGDLGATGKPWCLVSP